MPISIRNPRVERLARDVSRHTGENMTQAIERALKERLAGLRASKERAAKLRAIRRLVDSVKRLPVLDHRTPEEILGFDEHGLPR